MWSDKWSWLHYKVDNDSACCYVCIKAVKDNKIRKAGNMGSAFISRGFMGWKDVCATLRSMKFLNPLCYNGSCEAVVVLPLTTRDYLEGTAKKRQRIKLCFKSFIKSLFFVQAGIGSSGE